MLDWEREEINKKRTEARPGTLFGFAGVIAVLYGILAVLLVFAGGSIGGLVGLAALIPTAFGVVGIVLAFRALGTLVQGMRENRRMLREIRDDQVDMLRALKEWNQANRSE